MKKPKGFKNPQKVKYWSESDLDFTKKGLEEEQFREQSIERTKLCVDFLPSLKGLDEPLRQSIIISIFQYVQWSLIRERVLTGSFLPNTLEPRDFKDLVDISLGDFMKVWEYHEQREDK